MKILNKKYKGSTWTNGRFPKPIVFDEQTQDSIPFLEKMGFEFLLMEVCDDCLKEKCKCKKKTNEVKQELRK